MAFGEDTTYRKGKGASWDFVMSYSCPKSRKAFSLYSHHISVISMRGGVPDNRYAPFGNYKAYDDVVLVVPLVTYTDKLSCGSSP